MRIYLCKDLALPFQCSRKTSLYTINRLTWQRGASLRGGGIDRSSDWFFARLQET